MCTECVFAYGTLLYNRQYIERISRGEGGGVMTCDLWRICHRLVGTPSNVFLLCWLVSLGAYNQRNILRIVKMVCTIFNTSYYFLKSVKYCTPTRVLITKWQPHAQLDEVTLQWFTVVYKYVWHRRCLPHCFCDYSWHLYSFFLQKLMARNMQSTMNESIISCSASMSPPKCCANC